MNKYIQKTYGRTEKNGNKKTDKRRAAGFHEVARLQD